MMDGSLFVWLSLALFCLLALASLLAGWLFVAYFRTHT